MYCIHALTNVDTRYSVEGFALCNFIVSVILLFDYPLFMCWYISYKCMHGDSSFQLLIDCH